MPKPSMTTAEAVTPPRNERDGIDRDTLARLRKAATMPDDQINLGDPDAPLTTVWDGAVQGKFFRPIKRLKSFRIDEDVLAYFEGQGKGYQTMVNRVLREAMLRSLRNASGSKAPARDRVSKT